MSKMDYNWVPMVFVLLISCWNFVESTAVAICFYVNRNKSWPKYATNLQCIAYTMCIMGLTVSGLLSYSIARPFLESGDHTCLAFLVTSVICLVQCSYQSLYICIQRFLVFMMDPSKLYRQYSVQEKRKIYGFNVVIAVVCGASVVLLLGNQTWRREAQLKYCSLKQFTNHDILYLIIASVVTVPYLVNGILFGIPRYQYAKQVRLLKQASIWTVSKARENSKNRHKTLLDISEKYRYRFEGSAYGDDTKRNPAPNKEVTDRDNAPGQFTKIAKNESSKVYTTSGEKSCEKRKSKLRHKNLKSQPTRQISPDMFVVRTKARALREMGTTVLIDAVIPVLFFIACVVCSLVTLTQVAQLRTILFTLVYVKDSLKTTLMVIRYGVLKSSMREMLSSLLCSKANNTAMSTVSRER